MVGISNLQVPEMAMDPLLVDFLGYSATPKVDVHPMLCVKNRVETEV